METKSGNALLLEHLERVGKRPEEAAVDLGVGVATVYRWLSDGAPGSRMARSALEKYSRGAVPASAWPPILKRGRAAK